MAQFVVHPIGRAEARRLCEGHPHAGTMPNSSRHYMRLSIGGRFAGLAVWGYGIMPARTPGHLFGDAGRVGDYLELCRFFVCDGVPKNTASKFLAVTHRILRRHTETKWLYTYAAGFQGLVGHIYKAAGYDYIGRTLCDSFLHIPDVGLVHRIALHHRYGRGRNDPQFWQGLYPKSTRWCGYNFRYIYWLCGKAERKRLLGSARFEVQRAPTASDLEIWEECADGSRRAVDPGFAKTVPIVKLKSKRVRSDTSDTPGDQPGKGGAAPTRTLLHSEGNEAGEMPHSATTV